MPTVTVVTHHFLNLALHEARAFSMPDLPLVVVPHPVGGIHRDAVRQKADGAVDEIIARLTSTGG